MRCIAIRILSGAVLLLVLVSCSARRPADRALPEAPAVEVVRHEPESAYEALYARVAEHDALFQEGVDLIVGGDEVLGEEKVITATRGVMSDAEECGERVGCDVTVFLSAFDRMVGEQGIALKQQAARIAELESAAEEDVEREPGTEPFDAPIPALARTASLLRGTDLREMITLNGPVKAALDDWLTWMRPMLMDSYFNYQFLRPKMVPAYEEARLPEALLFAMMATETGGKVHSYSRAGAVGPLQFIRSTGRRYGLKEVGGFDMRLDPAAAARANVAYLNDQFEQLAGSLELVLAAYNGGENRLRNLKRRFGSNLWDSRLYYSLPSETREYVPRILAAAWLFMHPEDYDLEFPEVDTRTQTLTLAEDIALNELSICLGQEHNPEGWFRTLRNLNPRLKPGERVKAGGSIEIPSILVPVYEQRCLAGELVARARELHEANYPPEPEVIRYTVRRGDTLGRIASRHRCASINQIAAINRIRAPRYTIREGQSLKIPTCH